MIYGHILRLREIMMIPEKVFPGLLVMTSGSASLITIREKLIF